MVEAYEARWQEFEQSSPSKARIGKEDVPFPDDREARAHAPTTCSRSRHPNPHPEWEVRYMAQMACEATPDGENEAPPSPGGDFKKLMKRWHPDKFTQKYGKKLDEAEKDEILSKVKEVFQKIQEFKNGDEAPVI